MTPLQNKVLIFIRDRLETFGLSPSYSEIRDHLGHKSKSTTARIVDVLIAEGYLRKSSRRHRGLELVERDLSRISTPDLRAELARRKRGASA